MLRLNDRVRKAAERGVNRAAARGVVLANAQSSGPVSLAQLARMGHPFRVGGPAKKQVVVLDPAVINEQTGRFKQAWKPGRTTTTSDGVRGAVVNNSPEAAFMAGTKRMIPRPVAAETARRLRPEATRFVRDEIAKELGR